jgi:hypothetical protein
MLYNKEIIIINNVLTTLGFLDEDEQEEILTKKKINGLLIILEVKIR